ncbi:hypothetical protein GY12_13640 [Micrococcus luteus]|nr:hypothetical protein GY12_13640 [Micrococcus luteus]
MATRRACSTFTTVPRSTSASLRWVARSTTTLRPSMWPPTTSGRNGWYVMYGSGSTTVTTPPRSLTLVCSSFASWKPA